MDIVTHVSSSVTPVRLCESDCKQVVTSSREEPGSAEDSVNLRRETGGADEDQVTRQTVPTSCGVARVSVCFLRRVLLSGSVSMVTELLFLIFLNTDRIKQQTLDYSLRLNVSNTSQ